MKYEQAMGTILDLQARSRKAFKDLPRLEQKNSELVEVNSVQHNEIQRLKVFEGQHQGLLEQVSLYGIWAKQPDHYQQRFEETQKELEKSEKHVMALKEQLVTQNEKANQKPGSLQILRKKNSRSTALWAKHLQNDGGLKSKPTRGTEPETAFSPKDQSARIVELEATVAARDLTITHLEESRNFRKNGPPSTPNPAKTPSSSTEGPTFESIVGSQPTTTALVHACEHEEQCQSLSKQVADDAETINQLRNECQVLRDEASSNITAVNAEISTKAKLEGQLTAKDREIEELQEVVAARSDTINELQEEKVIASENLVTSNQVIEDLRQEKVIAGEDLATTNGEINHLREEKATANTSLDELRGEHAKCNGQLKIQTARVSELEDAAREMEVTMSFKDNKVASLEEQIESARSNDLIERQNQTHNEAISKKDRDYQALYDLYNNMLDQQKLAEAKHHQDTESLNAMQQSGNAKDLELQRLWTEYNNNVRIPRANYEGRITELTNQLRQGGNTYTDLQTNYNTQAKELDVASQEARELRGEVANLKQAYTDLQQMDSSTDTNCEKYRVEGENRVRPAWQATLDRELSAQALKLEESERKVFKLENQLQQAKTKANPLREMQIKAREDAVKGKEDALMLGGTDAIDHDHHQAGPKAEQEEVKALKRELAAATKDAGDAKTRNRGIQSLLTKERKERADEKARHEKLLQKEQDDSARRSEVLKIRLEKENPLKSTVSRLQDEVASLSKEVERQKSK